MTQLSTAFQTLSVASVGALALLLAHLLANLQCSTELFGVRCLAYGTSLAGVITTLTHRAGLTAISQSIALSSTAILATVCLAILLAFGKSALVRAPLLVISTGAYLVAQVVSLIANGPLAQTGIEQIVSLLFLPGIVVYSAVLDVDEKELLRVLRDLVNVGVAISVFLSIVSPDLAYDHDATAIRRLPVFGLQWRLSGIMDHSNLLAFLAVVSIALNLFVRWRLGYVFVGLALVAIGLAEARNAAITALILLAFFFLKTGGSFWARTTFVFPIAGTSIYLLSSSSAFVNSTSTLSNDADTLDSRSKFWSIVFNQLPDRPLLGWGPLAFSKDSSSGFLATGFNDAHNEFVQAVVEAGIVGLALKVAFVLALLASAARGRSRILSLVLFAVSLLSMQTEVFFTLHLFGLSTAIIPALIIIVALVGSSRRVFHNHQGITRVALPPLWRSFQASTEPSIAANSVRPLRPIQ